MGTLWYGGTIYTLHKEDEFVEAVYVEDGMIIATGSDAELRAQFQDNISRTVDLEGNIMYPGFVDSHLHLIGHGQKLLLLDLSAITSSQEIIQLLKDYVGQSNPGDWIIGEGWNENLLVDKKIFHRVELDEIAPNNPMMLSRVCRHAILANTKALQLAGILDIKQDPSGGIVVKDDDGMPTGLLLDQAQELIKAVIPKVSEQYLEKALTVAIQDCFKVGLVGAHSEDLNYYGGFERTYKTFRKVIDGTTIKFRTNLLVHHEVVDDMHSLGYTYGKNTSFIEFGAMKIFADGALGGRTALLSRPYNDAPETSGVAIHDLADLKKLFKTARHNNMPVAIHVIGDLAFEYAIEAIEEFPPTGGMRDRLIHAQILRKELIDRAKNLSIILDIQPRFLASDFPWVIERIGEEKMKYCYAWNTLLENGFHCAGGSDAPIEPIDPLLGIHAAVSRKVPNDPTKTIYNANEKLSVFEAVTLFTSGSAYAVSQENTRGKIDKGFTADFTVLDQDLFAISEDEILVTNVMMTVVDDSIMYKHEKSTVEA